MATGSWWGYGVQSISLRPYSEPESSMLKKIPRTLKRVLSRDLQAQYKAGLINGELALTEKGKNELMDILSQEFMGEITKRAKEIIKEIEEEKK